MKMPLSKAVVEEVITDEEFLSPRLDGRKYYVVEWFFFDSEYHDCNKIIIYDVEWNTGEVLDVESGDMCPIPERELDKFVGISWISARELLHILLRKYDIEVDVLDGN